LCQLIQKDFRVGTSPTQQIEKEKTQLLATSIKEKGATLVSGNVISSTKEIGKRSLGIRRIAGLK
jgi:hypothetical protein